MNTFATTTLETNSMTRNNIYSRIKTMINLPGAKRRRKT